MNNGTSPRDVGDANVGRLLEAAYRPEDPDPQFVQEVAERLCAVARGERVPATPRSDDERWRPVRRRLGWAMGLAASVAAVALIGYASQRRPVTPDGAAEGREMDEGEAPPAREATFHATEAGPGLTPRPRPTAPAVTPIPVGKSLSTRPGERRRVALADGSILYLNENTRLTQTAARHVSLDHGEIYVEVAPRAQTERGATFLVKTAGRQVSALGTRFAVRAGPQGTGVVVTQGKVRVSGVEVPLRAGQQLAPDSDQIDAAPRASYQLDWTRELMVAAESPLVPCSKHAGGALIAKDPNGQEVRLTLRKYHIDVHIEDGFARTTIDQTYFNNVNDRLEGTFYFPLPADASLSRLAMYVEANGACQLMEGGMAEANLARNAYETIRYARRDPALLEWVDGSTFKMRVFPLEARKEKRIILSYSQRLPSLYGVGRYRFPAGHNMDLVRDWSFTARIKNAQALRCTSPTHPEMATGRQGSDMVLSLKERNVKPDRDVALEVVDTGKAARAEEVARFSGFTHEGDRYLMVRFRPTLAAAPQRERRDWVFLFESAANRDPLLARAQIDVIRTLLTNAEHDDTFQILTAGTRVRVFEKQALPATAANVDAAIKFLEATHLVGALDLAGALKAATPLLKAGKNPYLVHVGAGIAALGERREDALVKLLPDGVRYVGVGVGKRWNRAFMKAAADRSGGHFTQINPDEPIAWRAFDLLATLNTPRLLEVRVVDDAERVVFLSDAASLTQGEELCAIARVRGKGALPDAVTIAGKLDGKPYVRRLPVRDVADGAGYLPRTWARLEIERLLAEDGTKHKNTIVELSKAMYVMSPYTSLLVLETEADYARFNVDRGRKDHWAMYRCEEKIPIVYEPQGTPATPAAVEPGKKRSVGEVLATLLVRVPPRFLTTTSKQAQPAVQAVTALQLYLGAYALAEPPDEFGVEIGLQSPILFQRAALETLTSGKTTEATARKTPDAVQVVVTKGLDPAVVEQALRVIQGVRLGGSTGGFGGGGFGGNEGFGGGGFGGSGFFRGTGGFGGGLPTLRPLQKSLKQPAYVLNNKYGLTASDLSKLLEQTGPATVTEWAEENQERTVRLLRRKLLEDLTRDHLTGEKRKEDLRATLLRSFDTPDDARVRLLLDAFDKHGKDTSDPRVHRDFNKLPLDVQQQTLERQVQRLKALMNELPGQSKDSGKGESKAGESKQSAQGQAKPDHGRPRENRKEPESGDRKGGQQKDEESGKQGPRWDGKDSEVKEKPGWKTPPQLIEGIEDPFGGTGRRRRSQKKDTEDPRAEKQLEAGIAQLLQGSAPGSFLYEKPIFTADARVFGDLVSYAPGMNTSVADVGAVLEAETDSGKAVPAGSIDPASRALIDKARGAGWQTVTLPGEGKRPATRVAFNGKGQYAFERTLTNGLREVVVCDGKKLVHLYPDLLLGARRAVSRFHRADFADLVPWALPPVEDLARGADVKCLDDHTVAVLPAGADKRQGADGKPAAYAQLTLSFADGRLTERRMVLMPAGKVLSRETYGADGTVRLYRGDEKKPVAEHKLPLTSAKAPNLTPDTRKLVVVPLPLRTRTSIFERPNIVKAAAPFEKWDADDAIALIAADCAAQNGEAAMQTFAARFHSKGDRRLGFYVLLTASGAAIDPAREYQWSGVRVTLNLVFEHPREPLALYLAYHHHTLLHKAGTELGDIGAPADGFLQRLARFREVHTKWRHGPIGRGERIATAEERDEALAYIQKAPSPLFAWAVADEVEARPSGFFDIYRKSLAEARRAAGRAAGLSYAAEYEYAKYLLLIAGERDRARETFKRLYADALKAGQVPPINSEFCMGLQAGEAGNERVAEFMRQAAVEVGKVRGPGGVLTLAWQAHQLGYRPLAENLFAAARGAAEGDERRAITLVGVQYLIENNEFARAYAQLQPLLADAKLSRSPRLWRLGAFLATKRGLAGRAVACLEKALDLEYRNLPEVVNLEVIRAEYGALLGQYQQLAVAITMLEGDAPKEFLAKVVRAADRWRSLDPDGTAACQAAARILRAVGATDLAWDYLTTPVGQRAGESSPWLDLARSLRTEGEFDLADRAYATAFDAESTNAQILWDRAQNLEQAGRQDEARGVYRQLADGAWQERFQGLKNQARWQADRR